MPKRTEADWKLEINKKLEKAGWKLAGKGKNVHLENYSSNSYADYLLWPKEWENPLAVLEAKKAGEDLKNALEQAKKDALKRKAILVYAIIGSAIKTLHLKFDKPLFYNGEEVDFILDEKLALKYLDTNEYNPQEAILVKSKKELIKLFKFANDELKNVGLRSGTERFSEFSTILFLKLLSEQEKEKEKDKRHLQSSIIPSRFRWEAFQDKEGEDLLEDINKALDCKEHKKEEFCCFQSKYGKDIFQRLSEKWKEDPVILKKIISKLSNLHLSAVDSDVKGDAFEYLLKAYLNNTKKDLGEYFTPRYLVKFLVKLANPKFGEKVYDPFCGTGGILTEAFKWIRNSVIAGNKGGKLKRFQREIYKKTLFTAMKLPA